MTLPGLWSMSIIDEWFWIATLYDNKRDILISGMILSGIHCIQTDIIVLCIVNVYNNVLCYWRESTAGEPRNLVSELCCILYFYYIMCTSISHWH